mmetsp:Transcript_106829/g.287571  ORF Transcript_106829/g.287571 Transcript_106829/m.287571 type:complete len:437 (-) Transcript_106829:14-1324(-)
MNLETCRGSLLHPSRRVLPLQTETAIFFLYTVDLQPKLAIVHHAVVVPQRALGLRVAVCIPSSNHNLLVLLWVEIHDRLPPHPRVHVAGLRAVLLCEGALRPCAASVQRYLDALNRPAPAAVRVATHQERPRPRRCAGARLEGDGVDADVVEGGRRQDLLQVPLGCRDVRRQNLVVVPVHVVVGLLALDANAPQPLARPGAGNAGYEHAQREAVVRRQGDSIHGPSQQHLTCRIEGSAEGHGSPVTARVRVRTLKLDMLGDGVVLFDTTIKQHVPQVDTFPFGIANSRMPIDVPTSVLDQVELFAPASAAYQSRPHPSQGELVLQVLHGKAHRLAYKTLNAHGVRDRVEARHRPVGADEEEIRRSGVRDSEQIHRALPVRFPMLPHDRIPPHPRIWVFFVLLAACLRRHLDRCRGRRHTANWRSTPQWREGRAMRG